MAVVAHPDDCVIFAYSFMHAHPDQDWTVCYLTYTKSHPRGQEFADFWHRRQIKTLFLGHKDQWNAEKNCPGEIDVVQANKDIQQAILDQDLILTHNALGEYGHPHHCLVHQATNTHPNRITFAGPGQGTVKYCVDLATYALDEFPLHRNIVAGFHNEHHCNEYTVAEHIQKLL